jgi:nickel-dependent lactate racemase
LKLLFNRKLLRIPEDPQRNTAGGEKMAQNEKPRVEKIPYGRGEMEVRIPSKNYAATLMPNYRPGLKDETGAVREALENPVGTPRLEEIARGRKSAVIVVNDITGPTATYKLLPPLVQELKKAGLKEDQVQFLVATGTHRDNTREELEGMLAARK